MRRRFALVMPRMIALSTRGIPNFRVEREATRLKFDAAAALVYDYTGSASGPIKVRIALIRLGEETHMVSTTSTPQGFATGTSLLADVLASWEWT